MIHIKKVKYIYTNKLSKIYIFFTSQISCWTVDVTVILKSKQFAMNKKFYELLDKIRVVNGRL